MSRPNRSSRHPADAGMTIVEVVVALLVFAIIATGVAAGATTMTRISGENRSRQIATNLAEQDLDGVRAIGDPFKVHPATTMQTVGRRVYTVTRTTSQVTTTGADTTCGTDQNVSYLRVTASVRWTGKLSTTPEVVSSTVIAPPKQVNDAGTGAISIRVNGTDGLAQPGVAVRVTPVSDGRALTTQPDDTDSEGCAYAARVVPGTYKIVLSHSGYIDTRQDEQPTTTTAVVAGGSTYALTSQYDDWATFTTAYAGNFTSATANLPTNLDTTFVPNETAYPLAIKSPSATSVHLHPFGAGYTAVAGTFATADRASTCASTDPAQWPAGPVGTTRMAQGVRAGATATAGATTAFATASTRSIPMGVVAVSGVKSLYLTAKSATPDGVGNPGCTTSVTYTFGKTGTTGTTYIALPYGSWTVYSGATAGLLTVALPAVGLAVVTNNDVNGVTAGLPGSTVTLDPRAVAP